MRKLLAIALLLVLGLPLAASALALAPGASSEANLPVCCRRGGEHHCMLAEGSQAMGDKPAFALLTARCPFPAAHPGNFRSGHLAGVLSGGSSFTGTVGESCIAAGARVGRLVDPARSNQKRGPPTP